MTPRKFVKLNVENLVCDMSYQILIWKSIQKRITLILSNLAINRYSNKVVTCIKLELHDIREIET